MIATIYEIARVEDDEALDDVWSIFGIFDATRPPDFNRNDEAEWLANVVRDACFGGGEIYAAERKAVAELAGALDIDAERYPAIEDLEDEVADELLRRVRAALEAMDEEELRRLVEDMLQRMPDEDRIRLMEQILVGIESMEPAEREAFVRQLAEELGLSEEFIWDALKGGAAGLLPLLLAKASGFTIYLLSTKLLYLAFTRASGLVLPFVVYQMKNKSLSWLLGPWGMAITTGLSMAWFGTKAWRRQKRTKKLAQLVTYSSFWRRRNDPDSLAGVKG